MILPTPPSPSPSLLVPALVGLLLCACNQATQDPVAKPRWYATAHNTCGSADGPAVVFRLDTLEYSGCDQAHYSHYWMDDTLANVDSLKVGSVRTWAGDVYCPEEVGPTTPPHCGEPIQYRLEVSSVQGDRVEAAVRVQTGTGRDSLVETGTAILLKCHVPVNCWVPD
jgi:hypothetical protein